MDPSNPSTSPTTSSRSPVTSLVTLLSVLIRDGLMSKDSKTRFTMSTRWPSKTVSDASMPLLLQCKTNLGARPVRVRHRRCQDVVSMSHSSLRLLQQKLWSCKSSHVWLRRSQCKVQYCTLFDLLCYGQIDLVNAYLDTSIDGDQLSNLGIEVDVR